MSISSQHTPARRPHRARVASVGVLAATAAALSVPVLAAAPASASPVSAAAASSDAVVGLLAGQEDGPTARVQGRDGRLDAGCQDYPVRYAIDGAEDDWLLELVVSDRSGDEVASVSLHGVEAAPRGRTSITLCRAAVRAGRFVVEGVLTERDGYEQVEHAVEGDTFRLTRR